MAFLGSIGKAIGLPRTGELVTAISGSKPLGGIAQVSADVISEIGQSVGIDSPSQTTAQESQGSGTIGIGQPTTGNLALVPGITGGILRGLQGLRGVAGTPGGQLGIGTGIGLGADALLGGMMGDRKVTVTRKQQAQVKQMVELIGIEQAASILGLSVAEVAMIVTKKFRSRGQGITAAQLRTATRVNNRIIHMHDKLKSAYGTAARRTTTRRATGTRVTQIKN